MYVKGLAKWHKSSTRKLNMTLINQTMIRTQPYTGARSTKRGHVKALDCCEYCPRMLGMLSTRAVNVVNACWNCCQRVLGMLSTHAGNVVNAC